MLYVCRRRFRSRPVIFLIVWILLLFAFFVIHSDPSTIIITENGESPRLFCLLVVTQNNHTRFIHLSNLTWGRHCRQLDVVQYRRRERIDADPHDLQPPTYVNLWRHILDSIRLSIGPFGLISDNDILVIVPCPAYIFREKLSTLFGIRNTTRPLFIIHEQPEANAYVLSGAALRQVRDTQLIDQCLQRSYPGAREAQLWTCIKYILRRQEHDFICDKNDCFVQYHRDQLTLAHIKNGSCVKHSTDNCQSLALLYPTTSVDMLTLEFFKYRLTAKSSSRPML